MKVLIITYYWPPAGGPGVQRILKFAKYLPGLGWEPVILTVDKGNFPAIDHSLEQEIPSVCKVYRTQNRELDILYKKFIGSDPSKPIPVGVLATQQKSGWKEKISHWIRMNVFVPDAKIFWKSAAVREGKKIIEKEKPDVILSSSPPPTVHLIARALARWSGLPWIVDFRDPWTRIHYYTDSRSALAAAMDSRLERTVLKEADRIVCVSRKFSELLLTDRSADMAIIPNGYDEEDFVYSYKRGECFRIAYIGGLNDNRYYRTFFEELRELLSRKHIAAEKVELIIAGMVTPRIEAGLRELFDGYGVLNMAGYLDHKEALRLMTHSELLLLFTEKVEKYEGHLPGKLFEYLAAGNYVLGIGPCPGESAAILERTRGGMFLTPEQNPSSVILEQYQLWEKSERRKPLKAETEKYTRRALTQKLVNELERVAR